MIKIPLLIGALLFLSVGMLSSCGKSSATTYSADKPSGVMGAISAAVAVAGTDMGKGGSFRANGTRFTIDQECDGHSSPLNTGTGTSLVNTDADFPGRYFYCKLAKNSYDPESVQGSFSMVKSIACMLEAAGVQFNGVAQTLTATPNTSCFTQAQLTNMGTPASMTISVTGSAPAAFNTHYGKGAVITVPNFGTFSIAANVSDANIEFMAVEDQTTNGDGTTGKTGTYAGSLNTTTGDLRFEGRQDRFSGAGAGCASNSCGWARHMRIYSKLTMSGGSPTGIESISGAATEMYAPGNGNSGYLVTASGSIATGIKPLFYSATGNAAALNTLSSYTAGPNSRCYTSSTSTLSPCGSTGITLPSGTTFPFSHTVAGFTTASAWAGALAGFTFTAVDPGLDVQP